jgi:flagellar motor switch protein FliM
MQLDGRLDGPSIRVEDLLEIQDDDVLMFDYPVDRLVDLTVNGKLKYRGRMVARGRKRAFEIEEKHKAG